MESQQIVGYIGEQLTAGHSEATLREHMITHGWSQAATDDAFAQYHRENRQTLAKAVASKRKRRVKVPKWTFARWTKLGVAAAVVIVLGVTFLVRDHNQTPVAASPPPPPTYRERQVNDVVNVAGGVASFAGSTNALPSTVTAGPGNSVIFCGSSCNSTVPEAITLGVYKLSGIQFKDYEPGMMAPDKTTLYLVAGAKCGSDTTIGDVSSKPRSMIILYQQWDKGKLHPRCVTL